MEARVDIRKLQQLNDRINQVLDALSQVRLSVYGLSHSGVQGGQTAFPGQTAGAQNPWAAAQAQVQPGISPYATQINPLAGQIGLQHSPFIPQAGIVPQVGVPQVDPRLMAQTGVASPFVGAGLQHSPLLGSELWSDQAYMDARASDPFRLARTFPYAFAGASPLSTGLR